MYSNNIIPVLLSLMLISCSEKEDNLNFQAQSPFPHGTNQLYGSTYLQNNLIRYASETIFDMYQISFNANQTRLLSKTELLSWMAKNEENKSLKINMANRRILKNLLEQDIIQAIKIRNELMKPFSEAVYVLIPEAYRIEEFNTLGALIITDAQSYATESDGNDDGGGESDDGGTGGGSDDGGDGPGEDDPGNEDTERVCTFQEGYYWDATEISLGNDSDSEPFPDCPVCTAEVVDCDHDFAGFDGCENCKVN